MTNLSRPPPNMNLIRKVCNSLGTKSLTSFVGSHCATGCLRSTQTWVKGGIKSDPLFAYTALDSKLWQSVIWECDCVTVWLCDCVTVWLCDCDLDWDIVTVSEPYRQTVKCLLSPGWEDCHSVPAAVRLFHLRIQGDHRRDVSREVWGNIFVKISWSILPVEGGNTE